MSNSNRLIAAYFSQLNFSAIKCGSLKLLCRCRIQTRLVFVVTAIQLRHFYSEHLILSHVYVTIDGSPRKQNGGKPVGYLGRAALIREQCDIFSEDKNCEITKVGCY
jgi:hypothetical protein